MRREWTEDEIKVLKKSKSIMDAANKLGIPYVTAWRKADILGICRKRQPKNAIKWTREMKKFFRENFPTMKNADLADKLGVSSTTVVRMARKLHMEKDPVWIAEDRMQHVDLMHEVNKRNGIKFDREKLLKAGEAHRFKVGVKHSDYMTEEQRIKRISNMKETRKKLMDAECRRIRIGLPQKTKLKLESTFSKRTTVKRSRLKMQYGYITFRDDATVYYDENTVRCREERVTSKFPIKFAHISERGVDKTQRVKPKVEAASGWHDRYIRGI